MCTNVCSVHVYVCISLPFASQLLYSRQYVGLEQCIYKIKNNNLWNNNVTVILCSCSFFLPYSFFPFSYIFSFFLYNHYLYIHMYIFFPVSTRITCISHGQFSSSRQDSIRASISAFGVCVSRVLLVAAGEMGSVSRRRKWNHRCMV